MAFLPTRLWNAARLSMARRSRPMRVWLFVNTGVSVAGARNAAPKSAEVRRSEYARLLAAKKEADRKVAELRTSNRSAATQVGQVDRLKRFLREKDRMLVELRSAKRDAQEKLKQTMLAKRIAEKRLAEIERLRAAKRQADKSLSQLGKATQALTAFVSSLSTAPFASVATATAIAELHKKHTTLAMSLAYAMAESEGQERFGVLALVYIHSKRRLFSYVVQLLEQYPTEAVFTDCFEEAVQAYSRLDPPKAEALITALLDSDELGRSEADALTVARYKAALRGALIVGNEALIRRLLDHVPPVANEPRSVDSLVEICKRAADQLARSDIRIAAPDPSAVVSLGFLSYRSALHPSTNIGDYVQTIAMMGLLARFLPSDVQFQGDGQATFAEVARRVPKEADAATAKPVDGYFIDRDNSTATTPGGGPIWLPINGWFMHPRHGETFDFPFADNIRPIFLSVHINRPSLLTEEAVAYLRRYGPVGTRDHHTAQMLLAVGVPAFFTGCPTLTLDEIFGRPPNSRRQGRYRGIYNPARPDETYPQDIHHLDPTLPTVSVDQGLDWAWSMLDRYSRAEAVQTPLLHCYLPCRAMGTEVAFTNPRRETDVRFEGLVGISEDERFAVKDRLIGKLRSVVTMVLQGRTEEEVYAEWRRINADDVARAEARRASLISEKLESNAHRIEIQSLHRLAFRAGEPADAPVRDPDLVDVVFCYDHNLAGPASTTIRSLITNSLARLRVSLFTRGLSEAAIVALSANHPECDFVWVDMTKVEFGNLNLLKHTTVSTMDRVFLPSMIDYTDRIVYLDIDIVILGDVGELYRLPLGPSGIGGRVTIFPGWHDGWSLAAIVEKQLKPDQVERFRRQFAYSRSLSFPCFNAGVLVFDLAVLREQDFTGRLLDIIDTFGINDQFAINLYAAGDFAYIPEEWNHFPTQERNESPKIIHYIGPVKPWNTEHTARTGLWRDYVGPDDGVVFESAVAKDWF